MITREAFNWVSLATLKGDSVDSRPSLSFVHAQKKTEGQVKGTTWTGLDGYRIHLYRDPMFYRTYDNNWPTRHTPHYLAKNRERYPFPGWQNVYDRLPRDAVSVWVDRRKMLTAVEGLLDRDVHAAWLMFRPPYQELVLYSEYFGPYCASVPIGPHQRNEFGPIYVDLSYLNDALLMPRDAVKITVGIGSTVPGNPLPMVYVEGWESVLSSEMYWATIAGIDVGQPDNEPEHAAEITSAVDAVLGTTVL